MPIDPRTPILVGAGAVRQRLDDPQQALELRVSVIVIARFGIVITRFGS